MRFTAIPECIAVVELATLLSAQTTFQGPCNVGSRTNNTCLRWEAILVTRS